MNNLKSVYKKFPSRQSYNVLFLSLNLGQYNILVVLLVLLVSSINIYNFGGSSTPTDGHA
jgi:hypothetical protein